MSSLAKIAATYGGSRGNYFSDAEDMIGTIARIHSVTVRAGNQVDSIQVEYILADGSKYMAPRHGGRGGSPNRFTLDANEHIFKVEGKTNNILVDQLTFHTINEAGRKRSYGPYGKTGRIPFSYEGHIVSFHGGSGALLDRIGFYQLEMQFNSIGK